MKPRLIRAAGKAPEETVLVSPEFTIGRDATNSIRLEDPTVSSEHCLIERDKDRFVLVDRNSMNGTFLNGKATTRAYLKHGDEILIGSTRFRFLLDESLTSPAGELRIVEPVDDVSALSDTTHLNPMDSAYLNGRIPADALRLQRMSQDMGVLLRLSAEINQIADSEKLQQTLLDRLFEIVPVEQGLIVLATDSSQLFVGSPVHRRESGPGEPIRVSRTVATQVFTSGQSVLLNDLPGEASTESIMAAGVRSVLCVPLSVMGNRIGIIYLATTNLRSRFDQRHLELVTAISGIASPALEHVRYVEWLETENRHLAHQVNLQHDMVGDSSRMKECYEAISLVAPTDSPVLVLGESGTGKELAARAIHNNSPRRNNPFVAVNCGEIAETLFSSALFGHARGAFTGADRDHKGFIEEADGGTLFLDELGDLPLHCQAALLRVLEDQQVRRVGATKAISVNIRLISATNRVLKDEIQAGNFRSDLFFRMGIPLEMPPLRDRVDDIPLLVKFFVQKFKNYTQREIGPTPPNTIRALQEHQWPGNVRELSNVIRWAIVFGKSDRIRPEDLPPSIVQKGDGLAANVGRLDEAMESFERQFILRALEETRGNVVEAAALLARAPNYLQRRISQLQIREELDRIRTK
jgi:transcriptional regulator with GAF, ATPase, and Fis domain